MPKFNFAVFLGIVIFVVILFWIFGISPRIYQLPKDFNYEAEVSSVDNFYDEAKNEFSGPHQSITKFSYNVVNEVGNVLTIKNVFDVRTLAGDPVFSVERLYGIDRKTGQHVTGYGDKDRDGYLFAPKNLKQGEPFIYWHINYDGPARMKFVDEEMLFGLPVYHYESRYEGVDIDQTENLKLLPGVGITRGINLDPYLQLWIEPVTGQLIKYKDETTAYYYDLATKERLHPWNKFSNTFKDSSIIAQVEIAKQQKLLIFIFSYGVSAGIFLIGLIVLLFWSRKNILKIKSDMANIIVEIEEEKNKAKEMAAIVNDKNTQLTKSQTKLQNMIAEVEKMNKSMVDRELKMVGLKDEVKKLEEELKSK